MTDPAVTQFPTPIKKEKFLTPPEKRVELIASKFREILEILGLDTADESLSQTPTRVAKMYVEEIFSGLDPANFPHLELQPQQITHDEMVLVKNISLTSFCEHHFVPMLGKAHVAYLPNKSLIGLSKINRIVRYFAKRPQLQERLTAQIADSISLVLQTQHVAVYTLAHHHCVISRGVHDLESATEVHVLRGKFQDDPNLRQEFLTRLNTN